MKLSKLLEDTEVKNEYADVEISFVTHRPEECKENCAFVCVLGRRSDGHGFIDEAEKNGASVFITQRDTGRKNQIIVENTRKTYALMCSHLFGEPSKKLKLIGVTGTNGKTTTAYMIYRLLCLMEKKAGFIGTTGSIVDGKEEEMLCTTPDAYDFNRLLSEMVSSGTEYCVCEVSSQALDQFRTYGCEFEAGVFTNISREHLDYHETFENYLDAKKKLFSSCKKAIINYDDEYAEDIIGVSPDDVMTFSVRSDEADITARSIKYDIDAVSYAAVMYSEIERVKVSSAGEFTVKNSLAALAVMIKLGFGFSDIAEKMPLVGKVRGRCERLDLAVPYSVIIDYAHTPEALFSVLSALSVCKKGRIITLFGCGGDRDKGKRADMGNVVASFSDIAVVTNDNPRNEDENAIIADILSGMNNPKCRIFVEKDRTQAIRLALMNAQKDDTVLLAGKGHEAYQIIKNEKIPFDEREKVALFIK